MSKDLIPIEALASLVETQPNRETLLVLDDSERMVSQIVDALIMAPIGFGFAEVMARRQQEERDRLRRLMSRPEVYVRPLPRREAPARRLQKKHKLKGLRP